MNNPSNKATSLSLFVVLVIVFCSFWPSLFNGFTLWDDNLYVLENELIRTLSFPTVKTIFTSDVSLNYTPLTSLSFALEYHFFGYDPFYFHLDNLLLHLLVTALVYIFTIKISKSWPTAIAASLLFGIHPMHVESVAWVTERKDVLYSSFYLLAMIFYWNYLEKGGKRFFFTSLACGLLSILSKPMALSLPFILLLLDWFYRRPFEKKVFIEKTIFCLLLWPIAWLTYILNSRIIALKFPDALLTYLWTSTFYLKKFFIPFNYLPLYQLPKPIAFSNFEYFISCIIAIAILALLITLKKNRWLKFALLFYFFSIFFLLRYDNTVDLNIVADRFMYLPSLGFCILFGMMVKKILMWSPHRGHVPKSIAFTALIGLIFFLGVSTFHQSKIWGDGISFWNGVIKKYPDSALAYNQRALAYQEHNNLTKALEDYSMAIRLKPQYDFALTNRGIVYKELGEWQKAWDDHTRAIQANPDFSEAYLNRGNVLFSSGDFKGAIEDYHKAIQTTGISARRNSTPYRAETFSRRGSGYFFLHDYEAALIDFNQALKIDPNNIVALDNRAIIFSIRGEKNLALIDLARSLNLFPDNPVSYVNRAQLFLQTGELDPALKDLNAALLLNPEYRRAIDLKAKIEKMMSTKEAP